MHARQFIYKFGLKMKNNANNRFGAPILISGPVLASLIGWIILAGFIILLYSVTASAMSEKARTYVVIPQGNAGSRSLQSAAVNKALGMAVEKAAERLIGAENFKKKDIGNIVKRELYPVSSKYIYSFKILSAGEYLGLYYISINAHIRRKILEDKLTGMGFKIVKNMPADGQGDYNTYYVKFTGNFKYSDSNKFQKLMLKYSTHLKNLYVSSFSDSYAEIKILYYGSIARLLKRVRPLLATYLNARISTSENGVITVDVE